MKSRRWADVDPVALAAFMSNGLSGAHVKVYNTVIGKAAEKFAPLRSRKVKFGKPWYTADIRSARLTQRKLERKAMESGFTIERQIS